MATVLIYVLAVIPVCFITLTFGETALSYNESSSRDPRIFFFFPLFTPFKSKACLGGTAQSLTGVCYTAYQCSARSGVASGTCANGRGVCCIFQYSCGGSSSGQNYTYFTSPGYPASYAGGSRCTLTVTKASGYAVCQIKINMLEMSLAAPSAEGVCDNDFLSMSGTSLRLCGENKGQHLYVDFSSSSTFTVSIDTNSGFAFDRVWNLEIIQIPCSSGDSVKLGPVNEKVAKNADLEKSIVPGCTQYFTSTSGTVNSFNFATAASASVATSGSPGNRQIAGLSYGACVKPLAGYCSIEWVANPTYSPYSFTVSDSTAVIAASTLGTSGAAMTGVDCTTNFVVIENPSQGGTKLYYDRFCGNGFITTTSSGTPYVLFVNTAASTVAATATNIGNHGFSLNYRLVPC